MFDPGSTALGATAAETEGSVEVDNWVVVVFVAATVSDFSGDDVVMVGTVFSVVVGGVEVVGLTVSVGGVDVSASASTGVTLTEVVGGGGVQAAAGGAAVVSEDCPGSDVTWACAATSVGGCAIVIGTVVVVTPPVASPGEVSAGGVVTVGVAASLSDVVELDFTVLVCAVFTVDGFDGLAWVVDAGFCEVAVGLGRVTETSQTAGGVEVTAGAEDAAVSGVASVFSAVATLSAFDAVGVAVVIIAAGSADADDAVGGRRASGVACVMVLAESGCGDFTVVETEKEFGSVGVGEAVETTVGGFTDVDEAGGAAAVMGMVAHVDVLTEDAEHPWVDAGSRHRVGAELTTPLGVDEEAATESGEDTQTKAETGVEA